MDGLHDWQDNNDAGFDDTTAGEQCAEEESAEELTPQEHHAVLQEQIMSLCGNIYAATYRLLLLIREFDECKGWADTGVYHCAHWLNFTCGMSMAAAHERIRVAHALGELPLISESFSQGRISYSKVRAMTRVATPENEEFLLMIARHGTAAMVEKLVRQYRLVKDSEDLSQAQHAFARRDLKTFYIDEGMEGLIIRLPRDSAAKAWEAINQVMVEGWRVNRSKQSESAADPSSQNADQNETESKSSAGESSVGVAPGTDEACADAANEVAGTQFKTESNSSAGESSDDMPTDEDTGADTANDSADNITVADVLHEQPNICGNLSVRDPIGAQRADAFMTLIDAVLAGQLQLDPTPDRAQIIVHVDVAALNGDDPESDCHLENGDRLCTETARRMSCDASIVHIFEDEGEPLNIGRKTRSIPSGMRRALQARDRTCCFPGCNHYYHTEGHHIEHWAHGGETSLENLVLLCRFHHRLLHEEGFSCERGADGELVFRDPGGHILKQYYSLQADPEPLDEGVAPDAALANWIGDQLDYSIAIDSLQDKDRSRKKNE